MSFCWNLWGKGSKTEGCGCGVDGEVFQQWEAKRREEEDEECNDMGVTEGGKQRIGGWRGEEEKVRKTRERERE